MAQITHQGATYTIADGLEEKYKELIELVLATPSMNQDEKQYWFKILPIMNKEQLRTLYTILATEKKKLEELDNKYASELSQLSQQRTSTFNPEKAKEVRKELHAQEAEEAAKREEDASKLLEELEAV